MFSCTSPILCLVAFKILTDDSPPNSTQQNMVYLTFNSYAKSLSSPSQKYPASVKTGTSVEILY